MMTDPKATPNCFTAKNFLRGLGIIIFAPLLIAGAILVAPFAFIAWLGSDCEYDPP
jgi:hypothetical protein